MKQNFLKLATLAVAALMSSTVALSADTTNIAFGAGYRQDSITVHLKERGSNNPRARLDRHFKDLEIILLEAKVRSTLGYSQAYVRADFDYGFLVDGSVRDSLKIEDRFEVQSFHHAGVAIDGEYLRSVIHNDVKNDSCVWDADIAFGYPIICGCEEFIVAPTVGFSVNRQNIRIKNHTAFTDAHCESEARLRCHSNKFRATWWGPFVALDFTYDSCNCWNLYGTVEFHFGRARRQIRENTERCYFDTYSRTKCFYGPKFVLGTTYMFCQGWYADANISYQKFFSNNDRDHAAWASASIRLDLGYTF